MDFDVEYLKRRYLEQGKSIQHLADEFGISSKLMYYYLHKYGLAVKGTTSTTKVDDSKFNFLDPLFCYYAGLVITDGYLDEKNNRVSLRVCNDGSYEVLKRLRRHFKASSNVRVYGSSNDLTIHSRTLLEVLSQAGISGPKNTRLFFVPFIENLPEQNQRMFFRGILDGDGNIHNSRFRIAMKSKGMIEAIVDFVNHLLGSKYSMSYGTNSSKMLYPKLEMRKGDSLEFLDWLYIGYKYYRFEDKFQVFLLSK